MEEKELIERIKREPELFSEIFKLYYKPIFGYVFRRTGNFDDTADIASNTFIKAFTHIKSYSYRGIPLKVWLYRIATNEINMFFRGITKRGFIIKEMDIEGRRVFSQYVQNDKHELELELQKHSQYLNVIKALKTLPLKYQEAISLRYFEGKTNKEIVEILNIKEGTLKSLLSRGVEKLRIKCNQI